MSDNILTVAVPGARQKFESWMAERGGIVRWANVNLSDPGAGDIFTPLRSPEGQENTTRPPHWGRRYAETITDIGRFRFVREMQEVKRFRVAVRRGSQGLMLKLTDHSTAKVRKHCAAIEEQYDKPAYYDFDYSTQECVITVPVFEDEPAVAG